MDPFGPFKLIASGWRLLSRFIPAKWMYGLTAVSTLAALLLIIHDSV